MNNFEQGYESLLLLTKVPEAIDEFVEVYAVLLAQVRFQMMQGGGVQGRRICINRFKRLRALLMEQVAFVSGLKEQAFVDEFETLVNDTGGRA